MKPLRTCLFTLLIAIISLAVPKTVSGQNWDDVAFWSADFALNTLQRQAEAEQLETHRQTYVILRDGYKIVRGLVSKNHELHETFFKEQASVNPVVANYYKVKKTREIILKGIIQPLKQFPALVREYQSQGEIFTPDELRYIYGLADKIQKEAWGVGDDIMSLGVPGGAEKQNKDPARRQELVELIEEQNAEGIEPFIDVEALGVDGVPNLLDSERIVLIDKVYERAVNISQDISKLRNLLMAVAHGRNEQVASSVKKLFEVSRP